MDKEMKFSMMYKSRMRMKRFRLLLLCVVFFLIPFIGVGAAQSSRDALVQPEKLMDAIGIKPGMVIGEGGAGEGYFTFKLARRVGETGKIYANDIVERVLKVIERRSEREGFTNITTILGKVDDPLFPKGQLDMVFMIAAFHDFEKPVKWLENVKMSMKPGAVLVIVEKDPDKYGVDRGHHMTKDEILETVKQADFELVRIETFLVRDNIYIFKKNIVKAEEVPRFRGRIGFQHLDLQDVVPLFEVEEGF
jgi:SAM-dependent methyltransferase